MPNRTTKGDLNREILSKLGDLSVGIDGVLSSIKEARLKGITFELRNPQSIQAATLRIEHALDNHNGNSSNLHALLSVLISFIPSELPSESLQAALSTGFISTLGNCFDFFSMLKAPQGDESISCCMRCIQDLANQSYTDDGLTLSGKINSGRFFVGRIVNFMKSRWTIPIPVGRQATASLLDLVTECRQNQQLLSREKESGYLFEHCLPSCGDYCMQIDLVEILYRCCITRVIAPGCYLRGEARKVFNSILKKPRKDVLFHFKGINLAQEFQRLLIIYNKSLKQCASVYVFDSVTIELDRRIQGIRVSNDWITAGFDHLCVNVSLNEDDDTIPPDVLDVFYDNVEKRHIEKHNDGWKLTLRCIEMPILMSLDQQRLTPGPELKFLLSDEDAKGIVRLIPKLNFPGERADRSSKISWALASKTSKVDFAADYLMHRNSSNQIDHNSEVPSSHTTKSKETFSRLVDGNEQSVRLCKEKTENPISLDSRPRARSRSLQNTNISSLPDAGKPPGTSSRALPNPPAQKAVPPQSTLKNMSQACSPRRSPRLAQMKLATTNDVDGRNENKESIPDDSDSINQFSASKGHGESSDNMGFKKRQHQLVDSKGLQVQRLRKEFPDIVGNKAWASTTDAGCIKTASEHCPPPENQNSNKENFFANPRYYPGNVKELKTYGSSKARKFYHQTRKSSLCKRANEEERSHMSLNRFLRPSSGVKVANQRDSGKEIKPSSCGNGLAPNRSIRAETKEAGEYSKCEQKPLAESLCGGDLGVGGNLKKPSLEQTKGAQSSNALIEQCTPDSLDRSADKSIVRADASEGPYEFVSAVRCASDQRPKRKRTRRRKKSTLEKAVQSDRLEGTCSVGVGTDDLFGQEGSSAQLAVRSKNTLSQDSLLEDPDVLENLDANLSMLDTVPQPRHSHFLPWAPSLRMQTGEVPKQGPCQQNTKDRDENQTPVFGESDLKTPNRKSMMLELSEIANRQSKHTAAVQRHTAARENQGIDFGFASRVLRGDKMETSLLLQEDKPSIHKRSPTVTPAAKIAKFGHDLENNGLENFSPGLYLSGNHQSPLLMDITNQLEGAELSCSNYEKYNKQGRGKTDTAFRNGDANYGNMDYYCFDEAPEERTEADTEILDNVVKNLVVAKQEAATKKRRNLLKDVYEKIKEKDRNVSQYVKGVTTTLASHCQQGMDGLAQKLQDIEGHLQHLQLSVKSDVDRMTEEAHEVEQQFEEAFQIFKCALEKRKNALKRNIQQVQSENLQMVAEAESKIKRSRARASKIPGLDRILKSFTS